MYEEKGNEKPAAQEIPLQTAKPVQVPRFCVDDPQGYTYLEDNGYVVFKDVATPAQIKTGINLAWDFLEKLGIGINRHDEKTWDTPQWPDPFGKGILASDSVGQCELLWFARGLPQVKKIYSQIWNTNDLITSFDAFCFHRPFEYNPSWMTNSGWYHLDQNGHYKPGKTCIQGFLNFFPSGPEDGGLVVIPKSYTIFNQIFKDRSALKEKGDFVTLQHDHQLWHKDLPEAGLAPIKICCEPGDFVLWDSRMIHSNSPATIPRPLPKNGLLSPRRIVTYICMTPASRLTEEVRAKRILCYEQGFTTTHLPEEASVPNSRKSTQNNYTPIQLTEEQKRLIPL
jgi:ectoine hydroxylase-related dioxygenase (phytanoyl-CoA dioxygenase family)